MILALVSVPIQRDSGRCLMLMDVVKPTSSKLELVLGMESRGEDGWRSVARLTWTVISATATRDGNARPSATVAHGRASCTGRSMRLRLVGRLDRHAGCNGSSRCASAKGMVRRGDQVSGGSLH